MLVDRALHPINLYYRGMQAWPKDFPRELGHRVEAYTGKQLALVAPPGDLVSEITWKDSQGEHKSVDWFWKTPRATILIECKSARLTLAATAGDESLSTVVDQTVGKARDQLDKTAARIRAQSAPFDTFDPALPIVGIVVTAESIYLSNSGLQEYGAPSKVPSLVISLRELEYWVTLPPEEAVDSFLSILEDDERSSWAFSQAIGMKGGGPRNPILDEAWKHYRFGDFADSDETAPV